MKNFLINQIVVISSQLRKAKIVDFNDKITVLTSFDNGKDFNRTGKSLILKSLIMGLGGNLVKLPTNWSEMSISTIITLTIENKGYNITRIGDKFAVSDENDVILQKYSSVGEFKNFYKEFLGHDLKLENKNSKSIEQTYPGTFLFPLYIDQDKDWDGSHNSMQDIKMYKDWKKEIIGYHVGKDLKSYYKLVSEQNELKIEEKSKNQELNILSNYVSVQVEKNKEVIDLKVDDQDYKVNIENYLKIIEKLKRKHSNYEQDLQKLYNERYILLEKQKTAKRALLETEKDEKYLNTKLKVKQVECPTCGAIHENKITHRYKIFENIENIKVKESKYTDDIKKIEISINQLKEEYNSNRDELERYNKLLSDKQKSNVSLNDVIQTKVMNKLLDDVNNDIEKLTSKIDNVVSKKNDLTNKKRAIAKKNNTIDELFSTSINKYLKDLLVTDMESTSKKSIGLKINSTGNDNSRAVLAEFFAHLDLIKSNSNDSIFPIIIDTPLQQDPSIENILLVLEFIRDKSNNNYQLILATTQLHDIEYPGKKINFLNKNSVLNDEDWIESEKSYKMAIDALYND